MGWQDERVIQYSIARLARLKVNRIRACIAGRTSVFYGEPAMNGDTWNVWLTPFMAEDTKDFSHPGFDWTRFNVAYWQKYDRMLRFARDRDMIMSLIFDMNDNHSHPAAGSEDEHRYFRYAAARFGAFSNVTWDLGDDLDRYRDERWSHATGTLLEQWDPYKHLATSHPTQNENQEPHLGLVRVHFVSGVVARPAPVHAETTQNAGGNRAHYSADKRRVRV